MRENFRVNESTAMSYEFLIRSAYQCERYGVAGANVDIYRNYYRSEGNYIDKKNNAKSSMSLKSIKELYGDYIKQAGAVSTYIKGAIQTIEKNNPNTSDEQNKQLEEAKKLLTNIDTVSMNKAVELAWEVARFFDVNYK